jgi:hypothetical protein
MEDCKICFAAVSDKKLPCGHELCSKCVVRLNSPCCPYCRQGFIYSSDEIKERIKLKLVNGYQWEVPPGLAFRPTDWINNNNRQLNFSLVDDPQINQNVNEPFSRVKRSMERRRRRFLSFDEVLERRQLIKERKARHWDKKNAQLERTTLWFEI